MHRHIITALIALAALSVSAAAQTERPDTIAVFEDSEQVTIRQDGDGNSWISVDSSSEGETERHSYRISKADSTRAFINSPRGWNIERLFELNRIRREENRRLKAYTDYFYFIGIYAGGVVPVGNHGAVTGGWEIGVKNLVAGVWNAGEGLPSLSLGVGLGWRIQTVGHGCILDSDKGALYTRPVPAGARNAGSKISTFHLTVPLTVNIPIRGDFAFSASAELHLNTYTTASASWDISDSASGKRCHENRSYKGLHQSIATIDYTAVIGWREIIAAYVTLSPMKPWKDGYGPQYKTLSIGALFNF